MTYSNHPEAIEDEIQRTRARIETRLDNLSTDISPTRLIENALGTNPNSTSETINALVSKAKTNPISALMISAGLAGLFFSNRNDATQNRDRYDDPRVHGFNEDATPAERVGHNATVLGTKVRGAKTNAAAAADDLAESAKSSVVDAGQAIAETASDAVDYVTSKAESISDAASDAYDSAGNRISRAGSSAAATADRLKTKARYAPRQAKTGAEDALDWVKDNPVPAGLMALAVGAAAASIFSTRKNSEEPVRGTAERQADDEARAEEEYANRKAAAGLKKLKKSAPKRKPQSTKASSAKSGSRAKAVPKKASPKKGPRTTGRSSAGGLKSSQPIARSTTVLGAPPSSNIGTGAK